jgi:hypothetical protein
VTVELDLYPLHSEALTDGTRCRPVRNPQFCGDSAMIAAFAAWTATVAQTFPTVHEFIVMNECNQPLFLNRSGTARARTSRPRSVDARSRPPTTRSSS